MRAARAREPRRGYTVMEVMMALAVLAIGATGVIALQKTTLIGNTNARNLATATAIATTWAERLRADGMQWTNTDGPPNLGATRWLQSATLGSTPLGPWATPAELDPFGSPRADIQGVDIYGAGPGTPAQAFCTQIRLVSFPVPVGKNPRLIRAEIRVFWDRGSNPVSCPAPGIDPPYGQHGYVYMTTAVHQTTM